MRELPRRSTQCVWKSAGRERYSEGTLEFDVSWAKAYLSRSEVAVENIPADELAGWMHRGPSGRRRGQWAAPIDPERLARADPAVPLILLEVMNRVYLIDGHHRLERGRREGRREFPAVVIRDQRAARSILRAGTPPAVFWWTWSLLRRVLSLRPYGGSRLGSLASTRARMLSASTVAHWLGTPSGSSSIGNASSRNS